ncbi:hypothetical protein JL09_g6723, partial [Pichia kudriavzevii]
GVSIELDPIEDEAVADWLYEDKPLIEDRRFVNGASYRKWNLSVDILSNLHRLSTPLVGDDNLDTNSNYLFDKEPKI